MLHKDLTKIIIKCFYTVYNKLGYGFLEKVYENSMLIELKKNGINCSSQIPIKVYYDEKCVGRYAADVLVEEKVILELKTEKILRRADAIQLINYLKATKQEVGLLLNFGKKPEFERMIHSNIKST